jgi:hypothetical protein
MEVRSDARCFLAIKLCMRCGFKTVCNIDHSTVRSWAGKSVPFTRFNLDIFSVWGRAGPRSRIRREVDEFCWFVIRNVYNAILILPLVKCSKFIWGTADYECVSYVTGNVDFTADNIWGKFLIRGKYLIKTKGIYLGLGAQRRSSVRTVCLIMNV